MEQHIMANPTASATLTPVGAKPGDLLTLTIDHADVDRYTLTVAGTVTGSDGLSGPWSATASIDEGTVAFTQTGGKTWTLVSATKSRSVFTTIA